MTSTDLIGPMPTITFGGGPGGWRRGRVRRAYEVPRNTLDPRHSACTDHHPACDCREAEFAEEVAELRAELRSVREAARAVLHGHRLINTDAAYLNKTTGPFDWDTYQRERGALACQCTGCQIIRRSDLLLGGEYHYETGVIA